MEPRRLRRLPRANLGGVEVPLARGLRSRLLGLALLDRESAGAGLLIPRCRSVHTFGMRFRLDVVFLDRDGLPLRSVEALAPCRIVACAGAAAVLEAPHAFAGQASGVGVRHTKQGDEMSLIDKLTGRTKKAAGDLADDPSLRREGRREERKGEAKEQRDRAEEAVEEKSEEVADLERKT
jgi:uncharacterized protein YjbJ (UPF0337 family)